MSRWEIKHRQKSFNYSSYSFNCFIYWIIILSPIIFRIYREVMCSFNVQQRAPNTTQRPQLYTNRCCFTRARTPETALALFRHRHVRSRVALQVETCARSHARLVEVLLWRWRCCAWRRRGRRPGACERQQQPHPPHPHPSSSQGINMAVQRFPHWHNHPGEYLRTPPALGTFPPDRSHRSDSVRGPKRNVPAEVLTQTSGSELLVASYPEQMAFMSRFSRSRSSSRSPSRKESEPSPNLSVSELERLLCTGKTACNHADEVWPRLYIGDQWVWTGQPPSPKDHGNGTFQKSCQNGSRWFEPRLVAMEIHPAVVSDQTHRSTFQLFYCKTCFFTGYPGPERVRISGIYLFIL